MVRATRPGEFEDSAMSVGYGADQSVGTQWKQPAQQEPTMIDVTQEDIQAALAHIGFDSVADLHYWATDNNELQRFDALCEVLAAHRIAAEQRGMIAARDAAVKYAECHSDDRPRRDGMDWNDGYIDGCRGAAKAIATMPMPEGGE